MGVDQLVNAEKEEVEIDENTLPQSPGVWTMLSGSTGQGKSRVKKAMFSGAKKRGFGFNNLDLLGKRGFKQPVAKPLAFNDITNAIMDGEVKWEDIEFGQEHLKYIQSNKKLMIDSLL
jgi:hypothetical protein